MKGLTRYANSSRCRASTSAPHQPNRSEESIRRSLARVEQRWAAITELFSEYPKDFPTSGPFFTNSALVATAAVDLAGSDEDLRDRESRYPEIRKIADQARAVINTDSRPVADSAVASVRAIKGWSDESFSDWEARMAEQEETAARRLKVRYARAFFAVWRAFFSKSPALLQDPSKPIYPAIFENRLATMEQSTRDQIGDDLSVSSERVRQVEVYLRRILEAQIFDLHNPSFEKAAGALAEIDPDSDASEFATVMQLLGTTLATEEAPDSIKTAPQNPTLHRLTRAKQLADLLDLLGVPPDHLPQGLLGDAGRFWMGLGPNGDPLKNAPEAALALEIRMNQKMLSNSADDLGTSPVSVLGLSTRPKNCLAEAGIETVGELMEFSDDQLLALPNMGEGSVKEIRARLNELVSPSADLGDLGTSPVSVLGLSTRPKNCLAEAGIETVGELMEFSDDQLLALPNMGEGSVKEIRARLNELVSPSADLGDLGTSPVSVLGLSTRPKNCLAEAGIETVGELMEFSDDQLLALPNMGEGSVKEIRARLNELVSPSADLGDLGTSPVSVLGLSTRPKNCLAEAGIETVGELMEFSDDQLLALPNMGEGSVKEIRLKLEKFQDRRHD